MNESGDTRELPDQGDMLERSRVVLLAQWKELLRVRKEVLERYEAEAIHDLRVASRRFRATLRLLRPWIPQKKAALLKKNIRKVTRLLGALRNIDEALIFFRLHTPATSAERFQLCPILLERRPDERARVEKALTAFDYQRLNRMVRKASSRLKKERIADSRSISPPVYFSNTCLKLFQPIRTLLPDATSHEHRESRHALRIAIKKWRYFFEIVAPILGCDCSATVDLLKEYQTILGRMNDITEFGMLCGRLTLSRHERIFVESILQAEHELLLQKFTELIERKPLGYTSPL